MRKRRSENDSPANLDLAPFMNMVVILIPMLLLSVIFVSVGVVNVSTELTTPAQTQTDDDPEEPLELSVALSRDGFEVSANEERVAPLDGCAEDGPSICLAEPAVDVAEQFARAERLFDSGDNTAADAALREAMGAYDFRRLYNELADIKARHPDETRIALTGEPDIPYALLIRAMDVARFKLDEDHYADASQFHAANERVERSNVQPLFSDPVLAVAQ